MPERGTPPPAPVVDLTDPRIRSIVVGKVAAKIHTDSAICQDRARAIAAAAVDAALEAAADG